MFSRRECIDGSIGCRNKELLQGSCIFLPCILAIIVLPSNTGHKPVFSKAHHKFIDSSYIIEEHVHKVRHRDTTEIEWYEWLCCIVPQRHIYIQFRCVVLCFPSQWSVSSIDGVPVEEEGKVEIVFRFKVVHVLKRKQIIHGVVAKAITLEIFFGKIILHLLKEPIERTKVPTVHFTGMRRIPWSLDVGVSKMERVEQCSELITQDGVANEENVLVTKLFQYMFPPTHRGKFVP